ncbi:hypothetical protein FRC08_001965, partial [Ceratobasidium sp. 394]
MSRSLRSGRQYDPLLVPAAPKRRSRKTTRVKSETGDIGEQVSGQVSALTHDNSAPMVRGVDAPGTEESGKRQLIAYGQGGSVKLTPTQYRSAFGHPPPIRPSRLAIMASECDARLTAEASDHGDAASRGDEVAESVPSVDATPETQRCGTVIPETDDED